MFATIEIKGMKFFAYHGFYPYEREKGTDFLVDVSFDSPVKKAVEEDEIEGTTNYENVYQLVKQEMEKTSKLLENVIGRVMEKMEETFPLIKNIQITIYKPNAPIGGAISYVSLTLKSRG